MTSEIAMQNFERWNNALATKDEKNVATLYSNETTFLPTVSGDFKKGVSGAEEYFTHFVLKNPSGTITEEAVQALSENTYLHSGKYDFEVGDKDNRSIVQARFSFVWKKENDEWKILHHHSSANPEA